MNNKKRSAEAGTYMADTRNQLKSTIISKQCQMESYGLIKAERFKRKMMILKALGDTEMTAREIAYKLGFSDLNAVKPRLTELVHEGMVEVTGKRTDIITGRGVSIYRRAF
ncbi:MAG: hypothetical protein ACLSU9_10875 [Anaerovoracaceae bacterium]